MRQTAIGFFRHRANLGFGRVRFPTNANLGSLRLSALMVPYWVSNTPFITVEITGAGGQKMRCVCLFKEASATRGWLTLKPLNRSDEIRPLATPWTISLLDAFDVPLALGERHNGNKRM